MARWVLSQKGMCFDCPQRDAYQDESIQRVNQPGIFFRSD